ncbi:metallophosphoesterase family protein [Paenibacillus tarimensis]|uniref:metallophosphoesterase family protein n=1 Tax=Paenibacillus tarimensis TaxID=416012 RepID=UPI001F426971|nr:metallophosphoesterase family protein [Paenibacillus tarimensis]MCF2944765.1 metallophosphatase family protein [Paenibacillus tarimensis]
MSQAIAVMADIHSNSPALDAVLNDIESRHITQIVNLGDTLFGPIDPLGTADRLMQRNGIIHIMGNCDELLLKAHSESLTFQYVKPLMSPSMLRWIQTYVSTWEYENILFCHGTPDSNDIYLVEEVTDQGAAVKHPSRLAQELAGVQQTHIICGHSHIGRTIYLPDGKFVINPGSVGLPAYYDQLPLPHAMESMAPHARYAILKKMEDASWRVEHVSLVYDWERAARLAERNGRNDYAYALRTGLVEPC